MLSEQQQKQVKAQRIRLCLHNMAQAVFQDLNKPVKIGAFLVPLNLWKPMILTRIDQQLLQASDDQLLGYMEQMRAMIAYMDNDETDSAKSLTDAG